MNGDEGAAEHAAAAKTSEREQLLDSLFGPISESYYQDRVRSGAAARLRIQAAQSTLSLFVGGLVATFTFASLQATTALTKWIAVIAVCMWLACTTLYIRAVTNVVYNPLAQKRVKNREDLVNAVLEIARHEAEQVDRLHRRATLTVGLALVVTAAAFASAVLLPAHSATENGEIVVAPSFAASVAQTCGASSVRLEGAIETATVDEDFVAIDVPAGACTDHAVTMYVPKSSIVSLIVGGGSS
jgi:hypothetical protein